MSIFYQPKIDVRTGALMGAEAVPRWTPRHREITAVPSRFSRGFEAKEK